MALEMKPECEKCGRPLAGQDEAFLCSYECTVCASCVKQMSTVCPNWGGELVRHPHRKTNNCRWPFCPPDLSPPCLAASAACASCFGTAENACDCPLKPIVRLQPSPRCIGSIGETANKVDECCRLSFEEA